MARAKVKRGSTFVDMTAMCDVAFLLLTFFILAAKFKPSEAVEVFPPGSVSNKHAPQKDFFNVSISKDNKVFIDMDQGLKGDVLETVGTISGLKFSPADVAAFEQASFVGVPLNQLNQFTRLTPDEAAKVKLPGVPSDSTNNELLKWVTAAVSVSQGKKINWLIKGDNNSKYTTFRDVISAFKKNEIFKYNLVTTAEEVPVGSELYKRNIAGQMGTPEKE